MQGVYVDQRACMVIAVATRRHEGVVESIVYGMDPRTPDGDDAWTARCTLRDGHVKLFDADTGGAGTQEETGEVVWESGNTWRPLQMSHAQFSLLTARPYFPMTFVAFLVVGSLLRRIRVLVVTAMQVVATRLRDGAYWRSHCKLV